MIPNRVSIAQRAENVINACQLARRLGAIEGYSALADKATREQAYKLFRAEEGGHRWLCRDYIQGLMGLDRIIAQLRFKSRIRLPYVKATVERSWYIRKCLAKHTAEQLVDVLGSAGCDGFVIQRDHGRKETKNMKVAALAQVWARHRYRYENNRQAEKVTKYSAQAHSAIVDTLTILISCAEYTNEQAGKNLAQIVDGMLSTAGDPDIRWARLSHEFVFNINKFIRTGSKRLVHQTIDALNKIIEKDLK